MRSPPRRPDRRDEANDMRVSWITRPLLAILLLAVALVVVSGLLELTSAVRLASSHAAVEAGLVTGTVQRELARALADAPDASLAALVDDARLRETLRDGVARAPSIVDVAVLAPDGIVGRPHAARTGRNRAERAPAPAGDSRLRPLARGCSGACGGRPRSIRWKPSCVEAMSPSPPSACRSPDRSSGRRFARRRGAAWRRRSS